MVIYRIQDDRGRGPWKPGFSHKWVRADPDMELVPWFVEWSGFDPRLESPNGHIGTGCKTIDQLRRWFNHDEYYTLRILGYKSVKMDVDKILRTSDRQTVFTRRQALRKNVKPFELY